MIVPLHSPARSQRFAARGTVVAAILMACTVCFSGWRCIVFLEALPAAQVTMRGVVDDLAHKNGSTAIAAERNNKSQLMEFRRLTDLYGPVLSYRCASSKTHFYFPSAGGVTQVYDIHFANHDSTLVLITRPGISRQDKVDRLVVQDVAPLHYNASIWLPF